MAPTLTRRRWLSLLRRLALAAAFLVLLAMSGCTRSGGSGGGSGPGMGSREFREFRAIAGVSMGGYGALNLGTRHRDMFGAIGSRRVRRLQATRKPS